MMLSKAADQLTIFLEDRNLSASDIPVFVLVHTALSAILVSATWYLCYQTSGPASSVPSWKRPASFLTSHPVVVRQTERLLQQSGSPSSKLQQILARFPHIDPARLATSYIEAKVGRLFLKPVTVPGRLWCSWKSTQAWNQIKRHSEGVSRVHQARKSNTKYKIKGAAT